MEGWIIALIVVVVLLLIVVLVIFKLLVIVRQAEGVVIERFGKFHKVLSAGVNWLAPFVDQKRSFNWKRTYINSQKQIMDENSTNDRIDLRESVFNFLKCEVYTKDTILLTVNSLMYYRIVDIRKAIYEVDDLHSAISNVAQTQLKEVFGRMLFSTSLTAQDYINDHVRIESDRRHRREGSEGYGGAPDASLSFPRLLLPLSSRLPSCTSFVVIS